MQPRKCIIKTEFSQYADTQFRSVLEEPIKLVAT